MHFQLLAILLSPFVMISSVKLILIELFGQVIGLRRQQYLVPALAGTRHAILCMRDWTQCAGSRWAQPQGLPPKQTKHSTLIYCYLMGDEKTQQLGAGPYAK